MAIGTKEAPPLEETKSTRLKMSYEEFLAWSDEDTHAEWEDGEVIIFMPPKEIHQTTLGFLHKLLGLFVDMFNLGKLYVAPFEMKARPGSSSREPDILFVAKENLDRLTEDRLAGPADLIVEIISKDSVSRDRNKKFREYRAAGVREYWIIDPRPDKQRADFYYLDETSDYQLFATEDDERVESQVLSGFWLRPAWLWQVDKLDPLSLFFEMRGIPVEQADQIRQILRTGSNKN
ncbi:MAG: Uma2 family endonuclease [Chloroflexi bacterium]|nr:Uma2 family endonuclease [Chloroflexota bacterium]